MGRVEELLAEKVGRQSEPKVVGRVQQLFAEHGITMPKPAQPTPTQINRQDTAMIQSGVTRPSVDQQHRDHFAQTYPEYTGGMEGARTRQANTAVIQAQSQVNVARKKLDAAERERDAAKPTYSYDPGRFSLSQRAIADDAEAVVSAADRALDEAETALKTAQTQKADLDRERELLADVSTSRWDRLIRDRYADTDINGVVSETEVRAQKIKAKKGMVQAERDKAKGEMDAAQDIMFAEQDAAGDFWDPTRPTKRYAEAWRDYQAAKERVDELDVELNDLSKLDYPARNESAFGRLAADPEAGKHYVDAATARDDNDKLTRVLRYYSAGAGSSDDPQEIEKLEKEMETRYGLTRQAIANWVNGWEDAQGEVSVQDVFDQMSGAIQSSETALENSYDVWDMSGYERRLQKQQEAAKRAEETAQFAREHPVIGTAATVGATLAQPLDIFNFDPGKGKPGDVGYIPPDTSGMAVTNFIQTVRGTISHDLARNTDWELWGQNVPAFLYNTGVSMADSALAISTLGTGSVYLMGLNSAVNTAKEVVDNGGTTDQALKLGIAAGVAEVLFETVSVEHLLKPKTAQGWRDVLTKVVLTQGGIELSEEALTETANILAEVSILGQSSDYAKAVDRYRKAGDSEATAKQKAFLDMAGRVGWAAGGGFLSGVGMGGGKAAVDYAGQVHSTYTAQKTASTGEAGIDPGARKTVREIVSELPSSDYAAPYVAIPSDVLTGEDGEKIPTNKIPSAIRRYMIKLFRGKILNVGADHKVYISRDGVKEFSFPVKRMDEETKLAKMAAGANLDTTLGPAVFLLNTSDDGRHPKATGGWDNFYVMFRTDTGLYSGIVKTMATDRGREFYDITEIRREGDLTTHGDNGETPPPARTETPSIISIPQATPAVKAPTKTPAQFAHEAKVLSGLPLVDHLGSFGRSGLTSLLESHGAVGDAEASWNVIDGYMDLYLAGFDRRPVSQDILPADATPAARRLTAPERLQAYYNGLNDAGVMGQEGEGTLAKQGEELFTRTEDHDKIISGALNPESKRAGKHARRYYEEIRHMTTDVARIAKATGFSEVEVQAVKEFLFLDEHDLPGGIQRFYPDFAIGESWRRLLNGVPEPHDLTLLRHEIMERELMLQGYTQAEAHEMTSKVYDYKKEADEYYDHIKKYKKDR